MYKTKAPYEELDQNIVKLVKVLNSFEGIHTIGSCGGHAAPKPYQQPEGSWLITLKVDHTEAGWFALEFLTWFFNSNMVRKGRNVRLTPHSFPPFINVPGEALYFALDGEGGSPDWLARRLCVTQLKLYIRPDVDEYEDVYDEEIPF